MAPSFHTNGQAPRRRLLSDKKKWLMLAGCLRDAVVFERARSILTGRHLSDGMGWTYRVIWEAVSQFFDEHQALPSYDALWALVEDRLGGESIDGSDPRRQARRFLRWVYRRAVAQDEPHRQFLLDLCSQYVEEQIVFEGQANLTRDQTAPRDLPGFLATLQTQLQVVRQVTVTHDAPLFEEGWEEEAVLEFVSTGIPCLDRFFGGGMAAGEVYGFLGPMGSCKTTLAVQLTVNFAHHAASLETDDGLTPVAILVSTEMNLKEARVRLLSYAARIPHARLRACIATRRLLESLRDDPRPAAAPETVYEREWFMAGGYLSERKRCQIQIELLNRHVLMMDFSGSSDSGYRVDETGFTRIATTIESIMAARKLRPVCLILDHASALADKIVEATPRATPDMLRMILKRIPLSMSAFAKKHAIPAWVNHQLAGRLNTASPAASLDHTDAAECSKFGEYVDFAVLTTRPTSDDLQLAKFQCTKHRREPPRPYAVVRVDGAFGRIVDVSDEYAVDHMSRRIVRKTDLGLSSSVSDTQFDELLSRATEGD